MSGVAITGKIVPLNNGAFPVFEDINGQGGWRSVADTAARNAIPATSRKDGMVVVTQDTDLAWQLVGGILDANWTELPGTFYQTMQDSDLADLPQEQVLQWSSDFTLLDIPGTSTKVRMTRPPLPNVTAADNGDTLTVQAGLWQTAANAFISFATTALRDAYAGLKTPGMLAYVAATQCLYMLAADGVTWQFFAPSPALALQATWAVDIAAGSDNNSGLPGFPIATTEELSRRLCPNGEQCIASQNVTVSIAAGNYGSLDLAWGSKDGLALTFTINCAFTTVAATLASVVNTVPGATQGRITIAAGPTFTAKQRIRSTSGANVGAVTYGMGALNSTTDTFIKQWYLESSNNIVNIVNGTTVGLDTLAVTINQFVFRPVYHSATRPSVRVNDCNLTNGYYIPTLGGSVGAILSGCKIGGRCGGNVRHVGCALINGTIFQGQGMNGPAQPITAGCVYQGLIAAVYTHFTENTASASDGGSINVQSGSSFDAGGTTNGMEWSNGAGLTAITLVPGATSNWANGAQFGFGTAYATGYSIAGGANAVVNAAANLGIPSTTNISIAGQSFAYTAVPFALAEAGAFFALNPDTVAVSTSGANIYLAPAARGNIGATNVFAANPRKGQYRFQAYLAVTTAGTLGVPLVQVTYTDDSGVIQTDTVPFLTGLNVTTLGGSGGEVIIETDGASQVQYSVIGVTTQGALQYSLRVNCRIESVG